MEERNARLSGYRAGKERLTGSRRPYKKDTFRDTCTDFCIFLRSSQEVNNFFQFVPLFLEPCNIFERRRILVLRHHLRAALTEGHDITPGTAACPAGKNAEKDNKDNEHDQHRKDRRYEIARPCYIIQRIGKIPVFEKVCDRSDILNIKLFLSFVLERNHNNTGRDLIVLSDRD